MAIRSSSETVTAAARFAAYSRSRSWSEWWRRKAACVVRARASWADAARLLGAAREQLGVWVETLRETADRQGGLPAAQDAGAEEELFAATIGALIHRDPWYARGVGLPADIRIREADFTRQTLRGMLGYLRG